jgi:GH15 family glucan-1,4-alpha-glucosidase
VAQDVGDLGFLSDCQTAAVVTRGGSVAWWPGERFDGPSAFSALLDPDAGHFTIAPVGPATTTWRYLEGTLVLRTDHVTERGTLSVTDALVFEPGARRHDIGLRSPGALVRVAEVSAGTVEVDVAMVPRLEYGLVVPRVHRRGGRVISVGGPERLFLTDGGVLDVDEAKAHGRVVLSRGDRVGFVLQRVAGLVAAAPPALDPHAALEDTIEAWRSWSEHHRIPTDHVPAAVQRSVCVLQGLTYQPSGAIVAAATTSLPEVPGGSANWDYRYAWLRDASLIARALLAASCTDEGRRYFRWMVRAAVSCRHSEHVQIVFGAGGERRLDETELDHLTGFADSRPVRVGNAAWRQRQHDVLGEVLDVALALGDDLTGEIDDLTAGFLCELVDRAAKEWSEPDAGVWEVRDRDRVHTTSAAMCWVALDRGLQLADALGDRADPDGWARARDEVRSAVIDRAWNAERGAFTGTLDGAELDTSVLLLPLVGFVDADDPRMRSTIGAIEEQLGDHGLLRRLEGREEEGAFVPSSFWLSACHALAGATDQAREALEHAAACANDLGLLAEMADPVTRRPMGNTPQALSHVGLITAARCLVQAEQEVAP